MLLDKSARKVVAGRNLVLFNELSKVLRVFQDHEIPVIVLKGAALANSVYESIGERPMDDVDLLIHYEDRLKILSILEAAGYRVEPQLQEKFHPFNPHYRSETNFWSKRGVLFDLHWELTCNEWMRKFIHLDTNTFWRSAQPLDINGVRTQQLSPSDTLLHVCLHLMNEAYFHLKAYQDIAKLINHYKLFPWDEFVERVVSARMRTSCYIAIDISRKEFVFDIPAFVLSRLKPAGWKNWLIHRLIDPIKGVEGEPISRNKAFLVKLFSADGLIDVGNAVVFFLMPGPDWLTERYNLTHRSQAWLACVWHPITILFRGFLGVWEVLGASVRDLSAR
ncbi:MAG: nucleotidyltransferase family protein [Anaerolineaceae bacterium]